MIAIMSLNFFDQIFVKADKARLLDQGAYLFHQGDSVNSVFVVEEGRVELARHQRDGASIVLQRDCPNGTRGGICVFAGLPLRRDRQITIKIIELSRHAFIKQPQKDEVFSRLWAERLAREVQSARFRSDILSRKTGSERLDGWLNWYEREPPCKGQWKSVAAQIDVSPEALYRELAKRRAK